MKKHILLEKAFSYGVSQENTVSSNNTFDEQSGYWRNNTTNEPMMTGDNPERAQTKKADVETGEDQKGE